MKARRFSVLLAACVCMLSSLMYWEYTAPCEASVQIKGKALGSIDDIVKRATGSEFPEIQKHSLLLYERVRNGNQMRYQSYVLSINNDGSLRKNFGEIVDDDSDVLPSSPSSALVQKIDVSVSPKRFGMRRNVFYSTVGRALFRKSRYGFKTLDTSSTEDNAKITAPYKGLGMRDNNTIWGNACLTVKGMEHLDIIAYVHSYVHSITMATSGTMYFSFEAINRYATDTVSMWSTRIQGEDFSGWKLFDYSNGIRGVEIAAGDFDGDGYKNDIAVTFNSNKAAWLYIYSVSRFDDNTLAVTYRTELLIHSGDDFDSIMGYHQACPNVVAGDFDGDGIDEAAFVGRTFGDQMRVVILDYVKDSNTWRHGYNQFDETQAPCQATRCDFDGDGKDEIAALFFPERSPGLAHPRLERWYCDNGSITPKRDTSHMKGGPGDTSVLGYGVVFNNSYYLVTEEFSITAGPLTGTMGKAKLAEDVAISHINASRSSVYVIPTKLDGSKNFTGFGDTKTVFSNTDSSEGRRGGLVTSDFVNETLMLNYPQHALDDHDESYIAVIQALPYHVDNVDINGNLTANPINYTFSGFKDDEGNGKMSVKYFNGSSTSEEGDISFNMASTTETISVLGDLGKPALNYLKFQALGAKIVSKADKKFEIAAGAMDTLMELVTDKIDETNTKSTKEAKQVTSTSSMEALLWDELLMYTAPQHIWRYKILNDPLPSWYKFGQKVDYSSGTLTAESSVNYLTFTIYDTVRKVLTTSTQNNSYQPTHEEGNFFSYPAAVEETEGYNHSGELGALTTVTWTKGGDSSHSIQFEQFKINANKYQDDIKPSTLTKTISAIATFFGAKDPNPLPKYTSHTETFSKGLSTTERIDIDLYGRSTLPGEEAGHQISVIPFIAREGTLSVATAVHILQDEKYRLWGADSLYRKRPDPALVLPGKYNRNGATIISNSNNAAAMELRGMRFYVPELDLYSDNNFLAGLTYTIRVPLYNASFVDTGTFDVKLSYASADKFSISKPHTTMNELKEIQTLSGISLNGWDNYNRNKGWAEFTWQVPDDMVTGNYRFFVQVDPSGALQEVHESRLDYSSGAIADVGGNNEGYFNFSVTSIADAMRKRGVSASGVRAASTPSNGVIFRDVYPGEHAGSMRDSLRAALEVGDRSDTVSVDMSLEGFESDEDNITFYMLLGLFSELAEISMDATIPIRCTLKYDGDTYYPEAYLSAFNFKPGALEMLSGDMRSSDVLPEDVIGDTFLSHKIALVPHTTVDFVLNMTPRKIDWRNGAAFEIVVPELVAAIADNSWTNTNGDSGSEIDTPTASSTLGSSGGGCEVMAGSLAILGLAGLAFVRLRKHQ